MEKSHEADCLTQHTPVLANEVIHWLEPSPGMALVDGTLGGGGHTQLLADKVGKEGVVVALDRDPSAIARAERCLAGRSVVLAHANFCDIPEVLSEAKINTVAGVLLDIGLSSDQLADENRGFSFDSEGPLDLRFDPTQGEPAWRMLERLSEQRLADVIYQNGEERLSRRIARQIAEQRRKSNVRTAAQLSAIVRGCYPKKKSHRIDPATRTFQALRIAVNGELESLRQALQRIPDYLDSGGRIAVISFHSLEDRIVKNAFREDGRLEVLTRKPIRPEPKEVQSNPRSRSARMRVARRL